ncbi:hypothetical protein AVEN_68738-1 [Araneus ventricosus]|uniref:Uncharacterized protein n=1 Tax=Araneus ventricosus TaxID=182803 RepID=A0A4Y2C5T4_ARAVE|nr:hypothetical protein AVEN_68738-1 [Araneus ventricosus]
MVCLFVADFATQITVRFSDRNFLQSEKPWILPFVLKLIPEKTGQEIISKILTLSQRRRVCIQWIPSHVGSFGNDLADFLAKEGSALPSAASGELFASEIFSIHRAKANATWEVPPAHE